MANGNFRVIEGNPFNSGQARYGQIQDTIGAFEKFMKVLNEKKQDKMRTETIGIVNDPNTTPEEKRQLIMKRSDNYSKSIQDIITQTQIAQMYPQQSTARDDANTALAEQRLAQAGYYKAKTDALGNPAQQKNVPTRIIKQQNPDTLKDENILVNSQTGSIIENINYPFKQSSLAKLDQAGKTIDQVAETAIPDIDPAQLKQEYMTKLDKASKTIQSLPQLDPQQTKQNYMAKLDEAMKIIESIGQQGQSAQQAPQQQPEQTAELDEQTAMQIFQEALRQTGGDKEKAKALARQIAQQRGYKI